MNEYETGRPLITRPAYLVIKPISPASLRILSDVTSGSRLEGTPYIGKLPPAAPLVVRELESMTA
jgi:hypothetical protein